MTTKRRARILSRDLAGLRVIGKWKCIARYHLKAWIFSEVSDTMASRFVERMTERGYLGAKRLNGIGTQLLWLTPTGRDFLCEHGVAAGELFPARVAVSLKDLDHTLAIVSAGFALTQRFPAAGAVLPAWAVQRAFGGKIEAIPDLLVVDPADSVLLGVEIDIGGEPLNLLSMKLADMASGLFTRWSADARAGIVVLTSGERRAANILAAVAQTVSPSIGLAVSVLPTATGPEALTAFRALFAPDSTIPNRSDEPFERPNGEGDKNTAISVV
jgi:hypothetical protein